MKSSHYGLLLAILSPLFSSVATILFSSATKSLTPLFAASMGSIIGTLILLISFIAFKEEINATKIKKNFHDLAAMVLTRGILGSALAAIGLSMTSGIKGVFFAKMEPYFVLGWHWFFFREKIQKSHLVLLIFHLIGAIILSTGGRFTSFGRGQLGDLLIVLAMLMYALSYIFGRRLSNNLGSKVPNIITSGVGGLIIFPVSLFFISSSVVHSPIGWTHLILSSILFYVFALTFWFTSLRTVKGWIVSALRAIGPIAGAPFAYFFFGETLSVIQLIGGAIVLTTSALIAREHLRKENPKSS